MDLTGNWIKVTEKECSEKYPHTLRFDHNGIYYGEASSNAARHPVWDVGTYEVNANSIRMSTANDAIIDYEAIIEKSKLVFKDVDGCKVEYKRV